MSDMVPSPNGLVEFKILERGDNSIEAEAFVPEDHPHMDGHFDQFKLLPAVSQVAMALDLASYFLGRPLRFRGVRKSKFRNMVRPEATIRLKLSFTEERTLWDLSGGKGLYSKGTIIYDG